MLTRVQPSILVDVTGHARITDTGLATVTNSLDFSQSSSGKQRHVTRWTAPEILNEEGSYSKEADVFSFAMIMVEARYEWVVCVKLWLTATSHHRRYLPGRFRSMEAHLQRQCWK